MSTLGILGAGQLGRMLAQAAAAIGVKCKFYSLGSSEPCAGLGEIFEGDLYDDSVRSVFLANCEALTYEWENIPAKLASALAQDITLAPGVKALEASQDRVVEKEFFRSLGVPCADFLPLNTAEDLLPLESVVGFPCIFKTRTMGYDGKGQAVVKSIEEARHAFTELGGKNLVAEKFVNFTRELSVVAVANENETRCYPLVENVHVEGILRQTRAPAPGITDALTKRAQEIATAVSSALSYHGVFAIELFETEAGLIVNEMAPRVHNSGHWTMDGSATSQFENHVRAVMNLPLGSVETVKHTMMLNVIGEPVDVSENEHVKVHMYDKAPRPGRKLGHVNVTADSSEELDGRVQEILDFLSHTRRQ